MLLVAFVFAGIFLIVLLCVGLGLAYFQTRQKQQLRGMLRTAASIEAPSKELVRPAAAEDALAKLLARTGVVSRIDSLVQQAGMDWSAGKFLTLCLAGAVIGFSAGWRFHPLGMLEFSGAAGAVIGLAIPILIVLRRRGKTIAAFEEQLPEALDFLSRSLRAGHGLSVGLEMLAKDSPDPLAAAFRRVSNELQLGSPLDVALGKLVTIVPLIDVRFFVSSVILQQETGGNLSEILSKLSHVIRERFRLKGQVKAASAHGRITGLVLLLMPVAVTVILLMTSPDYLMVLVNDNDGRLLIYGAIGGQIVAYFCIKKIVQIKV